MKIDRVLPSGIKRAVARGAAALLVAMAPLASQAAPETFTFTGTLDYLMSTDGSESTPGTDLSGFFTIDLANAQTSAEGFREATTGCAQYIDGVCASATVAGPPLILAFGVDIPGLGLSHGSLADGLRYGSRLNVTSPGFDAWSADMSDTFNSMASDGSTLNIMSLLNLTLFGEGNGQLFPTLDDLLSVPSLGGPVAGFLFGGYQSLSCNSEGVCTDNGPAYSYLGSLTSLERAAQVPEPHPLVLLLTAGIALMLVRRRSLQNAEATRVPPR